MTDPDALRTTFSFAPPVDDAAAWHLRLDDLAAKITEAFPEHPPPWAQTWARARPTPCPSKYHWATECGSKGWPPLHTPKSARSW